MGVDADTKWPRPASLAISGAGTGLCGLACWRWQFRPSRRLTARSLTAGIMHVCGHDADTAIPWVWPTILKDSAMLTALQRAAVVPAQRGGAGGQVRWNAHGRGRRAGDLDAVFGLAGGSRQGGDALRSDSTAAADEFQIKVIRIGRSRSRNRKRPRHYRLGANLVMAIQQIISRRPLESGAGQPSEWHPRRHGGKRDS